MSTSFVPFLCILFDILSFASHRSPILALSLCQVKLHKFFSKQSETLYLYFSCLNIQLRQSFTPKPSKAFQSHLHEAFGDVGSLVLVKDGQSMLEVTSEYMQVYSAVWLLSKLWIQRNPEPNNTETYYHNTKIF